MTHDQPESGDDDLLIMDVLLEYVEKYGLTDRARDVLAREARRQGRDETSDQSDP